QVGEADGDDEKSLEPFSKGDHEGLKPRLIHVNQRSKMRFSLRMRIECTSAYPTGQVAYRRVGSLLHNLFDSWQIVQKAPDPLLDDRGDAGAHDAARGAPPRAR